MKEKENTEKTLKSPMKSSWDAKAYNDFLKKRKAGALKAVEEMSRRPLSLEGVEEHIRKMEISRGLIQVSKKNC